MGRFYWFLLFIASAIATHAAYVLYYPGYNFDSKLEAAVGPESRNTMIMLTPAQVAKLFPAYATSDIVAMCRYDLTNDDADCGQAAARLLTFSIFTVKGRQVYSLTMRKPARTASPWTCCRRPISSPSSRAHSTKAVKRKLSTMWAGR